MVTGLYGFSFLNSIFGWDLISVYVCNPTSTSTFSFVSKNVVNTAGTVFSDGPDTLGCPINTYSLNCNSVDCTAMYGDQSNASVIVIEHGDGRVIVLGYDFHNAGYEVNGFHQNCPESENDWVVSILRSSLLLAAGAV